MQRLDVQLENVGGGLSLEDPQEEVHAPIVKLSVDRVRIGHGTSWKSTTFRAVNSPFQPRRVLILFNLLLLVKKTRLNDLWRGTAWVRTEDEQEAITNAVSATWLSSLTSQSCLASPRITSYERRKRIDFLRKLFLRSSAKLCTFRLINAILVVLVAFTNVERSTSGPLTEWCLIADHAGGTLWPFVVNARRICFKVAK